MVDWEKLWATTGKNSESYEKILKKKGAKEKLAQRPPRKKFRKYMRQCRKCDKIYKTTSKEGKVCDACKDHKFLNCHGPNEVKENETAKN